MTLNIATWNVNSVKARLPNVLEWLQEAKPDIVCLQELKCVTEAFPYEAIEELGYNIAVHGQKSYNGVAILSKTPLNDVITLLPGDDSDEQARYIEATTEVDGSLWRVASVYVPNGGSPDSERFPYKLAFFERLHAHIQTLLTYEEKLVVGGDYNVAPQHIDVYDPKSLRGTTCFHPEEQKRFRALEHLGLVDLYRAVHPDKTQFSWWDYRGGGWQQNKGMRIDFLMASAQAADSVTVCDVADDTRGKTKASDHAPVWAEFA